MIRNDYFHKLLVENEITFFTGVPDSLLKSFCGYIADVEDASRHVIAANEGAAVALGTGHYLASGKPALVYMQNSGQGNCINPLTSLTAKEVYGIPQLLLVGWRGEPGVKDEPQHVKQGAVTKEIFEAVDIPFDVLTGNEEIDTQKTIQAIEFIKQKNEPYALLVPKDTFEPYSFQNTLQENYELSREQALSEIIDSVGKEIIVSTTGKASREIFEYKQQQNESLENHFLTVGSMGHASQIALGIALQKPEQSVYCIDGDGAVIMHMGSLSVIGQTQPKNYKHILLNNFTHESVGGQPTAAKNTLFSDIAKDCNYSLSLVATNREELQTHLETIKSSEGPCFLEVLVRNESRKDLGRPTSTPQENKQKFMEFIQQNAT